MIRRLIILLLIVGCGTEPTSTNICVQSHPNSISYDFCYEWTDSENSCIMNGGTFLMDSTCENYCSDFLNNDTTGRGCLICNNSNPDCS